MEAAFYHTPRNAPLQQNCIHRPVDLNIADIKQIFDILVRKLSYILEATFEKHFDKIKAYNSALALKIQIVVAYKDLMNPHFLKCRPNLAQDFLKSKHPKPADIKELFLGALNQDLFSLAEQIVKLCTEIDKQDLIAMAWEADGKDVPKSFLKLPNPLKSLQAI